MPPVPTRLSATVLLVRDGARGLEVFMVERHHRIDFATGALVFPGGVVDPPDAAPGLRDRCRGADAWDDDERSVRVAAIRETFEECGVLLAHPRGSDALVDADALAGIAERHREDLLAHRLDLGAVAEGEDLELATDRLVPFAHWITPEFMPKRFDTWFFLADAPPDQGAAHDGTESVDSVWTTVEAARAADREGRRTIIFPTLMNLGRLGRSTSVSGALDLARREPPVTVLPTLETDDDGARRLVMPEDAGYDPSWAPEQRLP